MSEILFSFDVCLSDQLKTVKDTDFKFDTHYFQRQSGHESVKNFSKRGPQNT